MGGVVVEEKEQLEALDFTIDPRVNWSLHAKAEAKEVRKRLGAIRRIAHMLDDRAKMMAYKALNKIKFATSPLGSLALFKPLTATVAGSMPAWCKAHLQWSLGKRRNRSG